jgi:allophanate hydrolase subunit 2
MVDHPTIGGYPKIATVILNDIAKLSNQSFGKEVCFKKVSIEMAEKLYNENTRYLDKMFQSINLL